MGVAKTHALIRNQRNGEACHTVYTTKYAPKDCKATVKMLRLYQRNVLKRDREKRSGIYVKNQK